MYIIIYTLKYEEEQFCLIFKSLLVCMLMLHHVSFPPSLFVCLSVSLAHTEKHPSLFKMCNEVGFCLVFHQQNTPEMCLVSHKNEHDHFRALVCCVTGFAQSFKVFVSLG